MDWLDEWWTSAQAAGGFWRREHPAEHFRTAVGDAVDPHLTAAFVAVLVDVVDRVVPAGGGPRNELRGLVDLGAADGSLLRGVSERRPDWTLRGVDMRPAPPGLPTAAAWTQAVWDVRATEWTDPEGRPIRAPWTDAPGGPLLVLAHEWLDDLPCRVARRGHAGWELLGPVGGTGVAPSPDEIAWLETWAGSARVAEIGLTRERAWARIAASLPVGSVLVAVDYGHLRATRPPEGALLGYRAGLRVDPVPDGCTNITAAVAVDALAAAVEAVPGVRRVLSARQADLGIVAAKASVPASATLDRLLASNRRRVLADPSRWGANWWLVHTIDTTS